MPSDRPIPGDPFHYDLPAGLIAQEPANRRADSRLLWLDPTTGDLHNHRFRDLPHLLIPGDLLVLNDSRVLPARLWTRRQDSAGRVELLLVRPQPAVGPGAWLAMARPVRRLRAGLRLILTDPRGEEAEAPPLEILAVRGGGFVQVTAAVDLGSLAQQWGEMPLPPYIRRAVADPDWERRREQDRERYQTVYARHPGSVAAPTAGLHFETALLQSLLASGIGTTRVTLHVGPGTFRPPTISQSTRRRLHREYFHYPAETDAAIRQAQARSGRIVAVGTTSLRVLETVRLLQSTEAAPDGAILATTTRSEVRWPESQRGSLPLFVGTARRLSLGWDVQGSTRLFIQPPDTVQSADGLLTNFHLPGSSLLMLVAALAPDPLWRRAYRHAVEHRFRFYSYGDAMLILARAKKDSRDVAETST